MKLPQLSDFIKNSYYLRIKHPKWADFRDMPTPTLIIGWPVYLYVCIYPPLLLGVWLFSLLFSGLFANMPLFANLSRYAEYTNTSALSSAIYDDIMTVALWPVTVPYNIITNTFMNDLLAGILEFLFFMGIIIAAVYVVILIFKISFGLYKLIWRLFL